ncbi:putative O-glycosylation ligase, exosortase A system-associated [Nitrosococcus wardiae]|uniref:Putative O-glycosylation ligase, exosortase A system-associated n=1 Tax=Nitrosococcus wardiae TaxID=1814290 RepID=A0A4P7BZ83_9GAMM|nr:putative O-glycosylation ligase, exosortase A system-associated [Nitrosococcus wardiae]QBQ54510.1 putative O-glycosylation ligase, exosortase A system-associated [Nitrosococcus wardiae]
MRDLAVFLAVFGTLPFILARPWVGILVLSWIGYMNPHRLAWGFAYDFPFAQVVAMTLFLSILLSKEPKRIPWTRETVVLLLFTLWMLVSTIDAQFSYLAWEQWDKVWKIQLIVFLTLMLITDKQRITLLVWVIVLSIGFYGVKGGLFTIFTGGSSRVLGPPQSFIETRGAIALALNMVIPLMRYLQLQTQNPSARMAFTLAIGLTVFAVVGTQSRGGLLGLLTMGAMLTLKTRGAALFAVFGAVVLALAFYFMPAQWKERMEMLTTPEQTAQQDASARQRIDAWSFGYYKALSEPLTGGGFEVYVEHGVEAHSIWFEVLGEQGFIGFGLYLVLWLTTWRSASRIIKIVGKRQDIRWMRDLAAMIQASLIAYAAGGSFLGLAYFDFFYTLIALIVICKVLLNKALAEESAEYSTPIGNYPRPDNRAVL